MAVLGVGRGGGGKGHHPLSPILGGANVPRENTGEWNEEEVPYWGNGGRGEDRYCRPTNVPTERKLLHDFFCTVCEKKSVRAALNIKLTLTWLGLFEGEKEKECVKLFAHV